MARQLLALLVSLGHEVRLVSRLRARLAEPADLSAMEAASHAEIVRLRAAFADWPPQLWFTYHLYYRAPDLLGPTLAREQGIAYVAAEASHAARRGHDEWASAHRLATQALKSAALLLPMTTRDEKGLGSLQGCQARILRLKPFLTHIGPQPPPRIADPDVVTLLTVAMMREGGKLANYQLLAKALQPLQHLPWRIGIVGDGPARGLVEKAFSEIEPGRIIWHGVMDAAGVRRAMDAADLFVWPGHREPYGMVYLEAAAAGLASAAMASGGVPDVVAHGASGLLAAEDDLAGLTETMARLITDHGLRAALGRGARASVERDHSSEAAGRVLAMALADLELARGG